MKRYLLVLIILIVAVSTIKAAEEQYVEGKHFYIPDQGFVPDETTAIKIAEAIWLPIYGKDIYKEKPFTAKLENNVWYVSGSLPVGWLGGVAEAEISKTDGKVIRVSHGK